MPEAMSTTKTKRTTQARGLPAGFGLGAPLVGRRPVQLGDYLDEDVAPSPRTPTAPATEPAERGSVEDVADDAARSGDAPVEPKAASAGGPVPAEPGTGATATAGEAPDATADGQAEPDERTSQPARRPKRRSTGGSAPSLPGASRSKFARSGPPRKQINMRPETLDRARELLWLVQEYGPQPDAKASEMFEALVDLLYEARGRLDLSEVPLRGKWGDASARQFPQHLKRAFADAILAHRRRSDAAGNGKRPTAIAA